MPDMRCMRLRMTRSVERMDGGVGADDGDGLALLDADAVEDLGVGDDFEAADGAVGELGEEGEEGGDAADAGDDAGLLGDDGAGGAQGRVDGEGGGDVVGGLVLDEGGFEEGGDAAALPVHGGILRSSH